MSDLLTNEEREIIKEKLTRYKSFPGECPRKILGIKSGERMELCAGCAHAEANIVSNCAREGIRTLGASLYCWCGVPCFSPCSQAIIQSGIKKVICLKQDDDYSKSSRWLLNKAGVELIEVEEKVLWE
jgi:deoxycytidylate deaminase